MAAFPQPDPAATVPLSDPGPSVLRSYLFDPNEDCAEGKIRVANLATHRHDAVAVCAGVLVEEIGEGIKLFLDGLPGLFSLRRSKLGGGFLSLRPHEMGTAALREPEMSHGDHDGEKRFREDFVYVVDEEALESAGAFREDWSSGVCVFEVFGYVVGVRDRSPTAGIIDDGEGVDGSTVRAIRGWGNVELTKDVLNFGSLDPVRAVWKTLVVEDKPVRRG